MERPYCHLIKGKELSLSGTALVELMQAVLAKGVPFRFQAKGWSMSPFIREGDVILINPFSRSGPQLGKVVAFLLPDSGKLIIHRVIGKVGQVFLIQGDNMAGSADGWVPKENILGQVTRVERNGKRVRLGLGLERYGIALFSRFGLLFPLHRWTGSVVRLFQRKAA